ncbi:MAG: AzlC family ABC transporter permease [Acidaminococcaceae bacterium]|nr:AzlC family ABC transporter permease [Acidaminococcaceae bacterium]
MTKYSEAFKAAFPLTLPICAAFLFLGFSYGIYMTDKGFSFWYPFFASALIYAGSMEFVLVTLLLSDFDPAAAFFMTLMVNSRHLFYGISMLEKLKGLGLKKLYIIFGMCDESFAINYNFKPNPGIDRGLFMTAVTLLNHLYWVAGATLGGLIGGAHSFNTRGLDFALPALFLAIFISQWQSMDNHGPAVIGVLLPLLCLIILGPQKFIPIAMLLILAVFSIVYYKEERRL